MRKILNKFITVGLLLVLALSLTACSGTSVSLVTSSTATGSRHQLEIRVPNAALNELQNSATYREGTRAKWKLADYLTLLCSMVQLGDGSQYEYVQTYPDGSDTVFILIRDFTPSDDGDDDEDDVQTTVKDYFFFYTVEVTQPNPFNGLRLSYDEAAPGQNANIMQMLKNGIGTTVDGVWVSLLPPIAEAFPYIKTCNLDELKLNLYLSGSNRMASDGTKIRTRGGAYYMWERKFDTADTSITLQYYRPNSLGWNIVAILAAGITVTVILLVTRNNKKKHKPTLEERFPYDPNKPDENLPSDTGGFNY